MLDGLGRFLKGLPGQVMGAPMSQAPQQPGVMGFPPMGGMAPPRRGGDWRQNLDIIGSGLREASGETGQLAGAQKRIAGAGQSEQQAQFRASLPADQQAVFDVSPELWAQYFAKPKEAEKPQATPYIEGPDGIYERGETGWQRATEYPIAAKPPERIEGPDGIYERDASGAWKKVIGFGAAPKVFAPPRVGGGSRGAPASTGPGGIKWDSNNGSR